MDKRSKIIIGVFALVVLGIIITEVSRPTPINWKPSYTAKDKIPFGGYILFNELEQLFPNSNITKIEESLYYVMEERDTALITNYMMVNDYVDLDDQELNRLLEYTAQGNSVFIAASEIDYKLKDTLNIRLDYDFSVVEDTVSMDFTHQNLKHANYQFSRGVSKTHFISVDTLNTSILGFLTFERRNTLTNATEEVVRKPNFIRTKFGKGSFIINTTPQAFSNYYLLKNTKNYAVGALAYLNDNDLYYDNYKKSGRVVINSPMRFVLNQEALKWAYYLTILGTLVFVLFKAKREQRIIPVVVPLENSSVEFARTVGSLYYQNKDYSNLVGKKIQFFLAELRQRYFLDTTKLNEKTIVLLAAKSGKSLDVSKKLIDLIVQLKNKTVHSEADLIELNKKITSFKS